VTKPASSRDLLLGVRALLVALLVPALLRLPLSTLERMLEPRRVRRLPKAGDTERWPSIVDRLIAHGRPFVRPGCLTRGVTLFYVLRRRGYDVRLAFGIGDVDGRVEGHCWLMRDGEPFLERTDPRLVFVETYSVPRVLRAAGA
jgi:transglutaminase superfamily protein